jgi:hypothetical protein
MLEEALTSATRLTKDIREASITLSDREARFLVDTYYQRQDERIRAQHQLRAATGDDEPHQAIDWLVGQWLLLEKEVAKALDWYTRGNYMGVWAREVVGIGPIIAAGLAAHIDIEKAATAGAIWRFAGLDPTQTWGKGQKRPWNARLKTLCWKIGESFVKVSGKPEAYYGQAYLERKAYEIERNDSGQNADRAATILTEKKIGKATEAFKHLSAGHLPPGQIHARAKRWAVKLFLSHWHGEAYRHHFGKEPPLPYPIAQLGHVHERASHSR